MRRGPIVVLAAIAALVVAAVAVVLIVATNEGSETDAGSGHDDHTHVETEDPANAEPATVAERALAAMFSWQPVTDPSPGAAVTRALPWLGGDLAAQAQRPPATGIRPLPQWQPWKESGDIVSATAEASAPILTTAGRQVLPVTLTQTVLHGDGSTTPYATHQVRAVVDRTDTGWRLTEYNLAPN
ncbi:hypothetical protein [Rhodococcus koreensis]